MQFVTWKQQEQVRPIDAGVKGGERCRSVTHSVTHFVTHFDKLRPLSPFVTHFEGSKSIKNESKGMIRKSLESGDSRLFDVLFRRKSWFLALGAVIRHVKTVFTRENRGIE